MAHNFQLHSSLKNTLCDTVVDLADYGPGAGVVKVYDGVQPATCDTAVTTQTLLVTIPLNFPAFSASSGGVATLLTSPAPSATAAATGTATWFRMAPDAGAGLQICDGTVGTSGADLNLSTTSIVASATVQITGGTITVS
ncbi:hypothetical protein [Streptomyces sp. NPDC057686]|uniref:hypothetical protein n=1 Tax=Streptomyces sp. NPDC057686 TaxID=3346212 RepID=UPI0036BED1BC